MDYNRCRGNSDREDAMSIVKKIGKFARGRVQDLSESQAGIGVIALVMLIIALGAL